MINALVAVILAASALIGTASAAPVRLAPASQIAPLPAASIQDVAAKRRFPAHGKPHTAAKRNAHGTPGCFHGVGKFGGGCR